jgi:hypothetical protein
MKVYILKFHMEMHSFRGPGWSEDKVLGTYASEERVKEELEKLKKEFLANGWGYKVQDNKDGRGFCGYHEMGSMSFIPGYWHYEEQDVIE